MSKLRILQLADFRWYNAPAHYALTISRALSERGHSIHLCLVSPTTDWDVHLGKLPFRTHVLNLNFANPLSVLTSLKCLKNILGRHEIQIVNAHSANAHILAAVLKTISKSGFKLVRTRGEAHLPTNSSFNQYLYSRLTDLVIVPARVPAEAIRTRLNMSHDKARVIHLGIGTINPTKAAESVRNETGIWPDEKVIGVIGRLSPVKGHVYFIRAAFEVLKQHPRTRFVLAAREAQISIDRLKQLAYDHGVLDRFIFLEEVEDIGNLISILDIGVVCSIGSETICRVLLEFMAAGKPVIGTRVNGIPDMIMDGKNGVLVDPQDSLQLAAAVSKLLSDESLCSIMGKESKLMADSTFSLEHFARQTERAYTEILALDRGAIGRNGISAGNYIQP